MRSLRIGSAPGWLGPALVAAVLITGCSADQGRGGDAAAARRGDSVPSAGDSRSVAPLTDDLYDTATCAEVRSGIDAFNAGDLEATVAHFEKALPLATAADDGSPEAGLLLAAVHYYAELAPRDYLEASAGSADFARWKGVTLGLCVAPGGPLPGPPSSSAPGQLT